MGKKEFMEGFGFLMAQEFAKAAPKDSGRLAKSFTGTFRTEGENIIFTLPEYWQFVEYGAPPHIIKAKPGKALKFKGKDGKEYLYEGADTWVPVEGKGFYKRNPRSGKFKEDDSANIDY